MKLFARFASILIVLSLAPALITGLWFLNSNKAVEENARIMHAQAAAMAVEMAESEAVELNKSLSFILELGRSRGDGQTLKILQQTAMAKPRFLLLALLGPDGRETLRTADPALFPPEPGKDRSQDPLVGSSRQSGRLVLGDPIVLKDRAALPLVYPLENGKLLYAAYDLTPLWNRLDRLRVGAGGRILLLGERGRPLAGMPADFPEPGWEGLTLPKDAEAGWMEHLPVKRGEWVGSHATALSLGWRALTIQPRKEAFAVGREFAAQAALFLGCVALFAALCGLWLSGRLASPLQRLIDAARRVAHGDYVKTLPDLGWGELRELSAVFNEMQKALRRMHEVHLDELVAERNKLDTLVQSLPDGVLLSDMQGKMLFLNSSARTILRAQNPERVQGLLPAPLHEKLLAPLFAGLSDSASANMESQDASGEKRSFLCRTLTLKPRERAIGTLLVLHDVTSEKELERVQNDYMHFIVHDLKTPLTTIDGFLQVLRLKGVLGEKEARCTSMIEYAVRQMQSLIADILDSARIETGVLQLRTENVDPTALLACVRESHAITAQLRQVELAYQILPPAATRPLRCDRPLMERVLLNLTGNALKFVPPGGHVTLSVQPVDEGFEFAIQDDGPGIPKEQQTQLFSKFKQAEAGKKVKMSFGLGLSICKTVVELHGGRIWVESEPGKGTRFVFRIPAEPTQKP
ncbi:MAG: ATP-binding protein [Elusimicrobiota bacterium]|jgi:NtrC-family two-component system sensor histidine kinase KinB